MPAKNSVKIYLENGFYHLYNRGVEKRDIFLDDQDLSVFLSYLKTYLSPQNKEELMKTISSQNASSKEKDRALKMIHLKNYSEVIDLLCFALMPNHFHLLVRQTLSDGINNFMRSLGTKYSMYFNRKYHRVGSLFQGVYKAVSVETNEQLLHLSRYIHRNPPPDSFLPTSLPKYLGKGNTPWVKPELILAYFNKTSKNNSYEAFMGESIDGELIAPFAIDLASE